ncbi:MAG: succinate dehydrogenase assembly factor 2 [Thiothrix sp.]|nr:succinate dehydrogenase assembly factor 2 [Thiothrix sp.]HPQ96721.1 succinate dehydrogenase assembly factor 2 [Thiolinea sp.]
MPALSRYKLLCRRGMKELDVVLVRYLDRHYSDADSAELAQFDELLAMQDPELFGVLFELMPEPPHLQQVIAKIRIP